MGFEPTRGDPNGLAVHRLNHSATSSVRSALAVYIQLHCAQHDLKVIVQLYRKITSAPPGNRTRVARMGILHDTTTPAARQMYVILSQILMKCKATNMNPVR